MTPPDTAASPASSSGPSNLRMRVLTAIAGIGLLVSAICFSEWGYFIVFGGISLLCQLEFYRLLRQDGNQPATGWGIAVGAGLFLFSFYYAIQGDAPLLALLIVPSTAIYIAKLYRKEAKPFVNIALTFLGIVYTSLPFALFNLAVYRDGQYSWQIALGVLLLLWASDTGAYFAGRSLGKRKLFERVSPKKTWEGFAGGLLASAGTAGILAHYSKDLPPALWTLLMLIIVIAGTYGDLTESLFKRSIAIKDSGSMLPGHGGFLDRFDGLLIALPLVAMVLILW